MPLIAGAISLIVYWRTLLPGIAFGDWGEMQTVPHVLGVAHPTGYPSYVILGWVAQLLPIGSIAFRANMLSAVLVALAVATASLILLRLGVRPILAIAGSLVLGAIGTVWAAATIAEVNGLHLLFVALLVHRALVWEARRSLVDLALGGLLLGLSLGNHLLTLFVAPFIVAFVVWVGRREIAARPWTIVPAVGMVLLGLSVYLYIPIAAAQAPPLPYNDPVTFERLAWLVDGTQFRVQFDFLTPAGPPELVSALPALWTILVDRTTVILPTLGVVGLILLVRRRPAFGIMALGILATTLYVWANYLRLEHYLLVPWLIIGIQRDILGRDRRTGDRRHDTTAMAISRERAGGWPGHRGRRGSGRHHLARIRSKRRTRWRGVRRSGVRRAPTERCGADTLGRVDAVWHAQFVLGERPDVLVVDDTNIVYEGWGTRERRIASLVCDRPVYILRLADSDLDVTRAVYRVEPFIDVRVATGGPTATAIRSVMHVTVRDAKGCPSL